MGLEVNNDFPFFSIGFKGLENKDGKLDDIRVKIIELLKDLSEKGFEEEFLVSVLSQLELMGKVGQKNKGIKIFEHFFNSFNNKTLSQFDIYMELGASIGRIKERLKGEKYFENLISKYLLQNQKQLFLVLKPKADLIQANNLEERKALQEIMEKMSESDKEKIVEENGSLKRHQEQIQDMNLLPKLRIQDIPQSTEETKIVEREVEKVPVKFVHNISNGVTSIRLKIDITNFPSSMTNYLYLLEKFMTQLGTTQYSYEEFSQKMSLISSGIDFKNRCFQEIDELGQIRHFIALETKCLDRNIEATMNLLSHLLQHVQFKDFKRLSQLIQLEGAEAANELTNNPLGFAVSVAKGALSQPHHINNSFRNTKFLADYSTHFMKGLKSKEYLEDLSFQLEQMKNQAIRRERMSFLVHTEQKNQQLVEKMVQVMVKELQSRYNHFDLIEEKLMYESFQPFYLKQYFSLPSYVNFVVEGFKIPNFSNEDFPKIQVASNLMDTYLHKLVREQGGAYGSSISVENRVLTFSSYRDPNYLKTYIAFEQAIAKYQKGEFSEEDIEGAKLKLFQSVDAIQIREDQGLMQFYLGITQEQFQEYRRKCLAVQKEEIVQAINTYLASALERDQTTKVIFGSDENNLEGLVSRGWKISKFSDVFSYKK